MAFAPIERQSMDTGSNYNFVDKIQKPNAPRSAFDLSHLVTTTIDNGGIVFPISWFETLPTDDFDISVRSLLRCLPQVVPMYSRQRLYIYAFYSRLGDLWSGFDPFIRKGYTGNYISQVPTLNSNNLTDSSSAVVKAGSPLDYFGIPQGLQFDSFFGKVSALPYMMYFRIWRDYFCNKNFYTEDRVLFPHDDARFRLNDDGKLESAVDAGVHFYFYGDAWRDFVHGGTDARFSGFHHDYPQDYFTSALPWPQRGDAPTLSVGSLTDLHVSSVDPLFNVDNFVFYAGTNSYMFNSAPTVSLGAVTLYGTPTSSAASNANTGFATWLRSASFDGSVSSSSITLDAIRQLAISQRELEKMARTDGSFAEFGLTFFGESSKNAIDYRPVYIGGTYTGISFTEVLQTSATTDSSALGQYAGHGIAADNEGYIGHCHCDDYGIIMILGCIMPDVYYSQGIDRKWTRLDQSQFFLPERARLGMQPIYNKELYFSGNATQDDGLWAYQDRCDEYRYMANRISGKIADKDAESFNPYTQSRIFDELPNYGQVFSRASDVRKDYLAAPSEVAYTAQFSLDIRAVRPLPYRAMPAEVIN